MKNNAYKECIRSGLRLDYYARFENLTNDWIFEFDPRY